MSAAETTTAEEPDVLDGEAEEVTPEANGNGKTKTIVRQPKPLPLSQRDPVAIAKHFAASGYFRDAADMSKAVVKIVAGEELGFGAMTAMSGIHIIEGKPSLSANLLATCVKRHPKYDYRVVEISAEKAALRFLEHGKKLGVSEFTMEQAQRAGLVRQGSGWTKYPEAMLFARALSQGVRWHCPDVTAGAPAYVPEELGATVDERGEVVEVVGEQGEPEEPSKPRIAEDRADRILKAIGEIGLRKAELDVILGCAGIDALRAHSKKAVGERIDALTPEEADALEAELEREVDRRAEAADAKQGEGGDDGEA